MGKFFSSIFRRIEKISTNLEQEHISAYFNVKHFFEIFMLLIRIIAGTTATDRSIDLDLLQLQQNGEKCPRNCGQKVYFYGFLT
jgi:UDP-N-acetylmuramate-alanine ligase